MTDNQEQQIETANQALNMLVQGVELAQKRGAYSLEEAAMISQAIKVLTPPSTDSEPTQKNEEQESEKE